MYFFHVFKVLPMSFFRPRLNPVKHSLLWIMNFLVRLIDSKFFLDLPCSSDHFQAVFIGSSISVFGTAAGSDTSCGTCLLNTSLSFSIDGTTYSNITVEATSVTRRHVPFFTSPSPLSGDDTHKLSMEVLTSAPETNVSAFYFDYIIYEATLNSSIPSPTEQTSWIFVDDQSPYLEYNKGGWSRNILNAPFTANFNLTDVAFNSSVIGPMDSSSTVSLNFTGTSLILSQYFIHPTYM